MSAILREMNMKNIQQQQNKGLKQQPHLQKQLTYVCVHVSILNVAYELAMHTNIVFF